MSSQAWVTLATNDSYGIGALVLAHSLRRAGSVFPAVVLITPAVTDAMRERLRAVFADVIVVDVLDSHDATHLALLQRPELGITFTKIHCWSLTQYEKCVFLDADTMIVQNCDELFEREELSAAPDVGWPDCFNSGVFVYRPSQETFNSLINFARERGSFDGGDQGLLNSYFSSWAHGDINKHLPFLYNVTSAAFYSYLPALKHFGENLKIIHFIGTAKPWLQTYNWESQAVEAPGHLKDTLQLWWDIFVSSVHTQLDESMVEAETREEIPPPDFTNYYVHEVNPDSEFPWHHSNNEPSQIEQEQPKLNLDEFFDPWNLYCGNVPPNPNEEINYCDKESERMVITQRLRDYAWEYKAQECIQETSHNLQITQSQPYHSHHSEHHEHHHHENEYSDQPHPHSQRYDHHHHENEYSDQPHPHSQRYDHHHHENEYSDQPHPHSQRNDNHHQSQHQKINSQPHHQQQHHNQYNQQYEKESNKEEMSGMNVYQVNLHNHSSHNLDIHIPHPHRKHQTVDQVHHVLVKTDVTSSKQRRPSNIRRLNPIDLYCNGDALTNGYISEEEDGDHLEDFKPRHPYDGFYLRHRSTIDSRGRKVCLHQIPPTPPPSPPPESPEPSNEDEADLFKDALEYQTGVAGNFARVTPGTSSSVAIDELSRRQGWEAGNIDYMGADSFDNIWAKISSTLNQAPKDSSPPKEQIEPAPAKAPSPPKEQPTPAKQLSPPKELPAPVKQPSPPKELPAPVKQPSPPKELPAPVKQHSPPKGLAAPVKQPSPAKELAAPVKQPSPPKELPAPVKQPSPPKELPAPVKQPSPPKDEPQAEEKMSVPKEQSSTSIVSAPAPAKPTPAPIEAPKPVEPKTVPKTEVPTTPPVSPKSTSDAQSTAVLETLSKVEDVVGIPSSKPAPESVSTAPITETPSSATEKGEVTPVKTLELSGTSTDSPPLANTPAKEEESPKVLKTEGERTRKPIDKLQLQPPASADPLPTPDSELEDAASLAQSIIASELATPTVTSATPPVPLVPSATVSPPLALKPQKSLSVEESELDTPPAGPVFLAQIGVKPSPKTKPTIAAQIESSVVDKSVPQPVAPNTKSESSTPTDSVPKKKVVKKIVKKDTTSTAATAGADAPVPPPRKKEKKPKD